MTEFAVAASGGGSGSHALNPADLEGLRALLAAGDPDGQLRSIGIRTIQIGPDALDDLVGVVGGLLTAGQIVVLMDATPMRRGAADLKALVVERLQALGDVRAVVIGSRETELHADEAALAAADAAIEGAGCVVSVGSGTITDIAKDASHRAGDIPLVVVQTAVSVNAFSDDMAVLLRHGVKRTVPSRWPDALIVDLATIAHAPSAMNRAGFGELLAMFTAPADWYLAGALGMDGDWHSSPAALVRPQGYALLAAASRVRADEPDALLLLARLMTLSGIALGVAGTSAPMSGTEHLISHLLDMAAKQAGQPLNLHGAQVGVTAIVAAVAWHDTLRTFDPGSVPVDEVYPDGRHVEGEVRRAFSRLDPTGELGNECWRDVSEKLTRWAAARPRFEAFLNEWPRHRDALGALVVEPAVLVRALREAGAATAFSDLERPVDPELARWALRSAPLMRRRFVLADFRSLTGSWSDADIRRTLAATATLEAES